ncbi:hypothetical protein QQY24_02360 [Streptomyces sp. TG1A-8]|uniref:HU family DNA-binding protein n=1 Tax=Streptomyces sp. TG1A-8 TaxID=3051385 RepID=UPI00265C7799|nr:hypothetical protein [Streptomyces sp. TG1A-8]MDO0924308.1 hypothetical protein [Streptomyces sp. TG1A-8]
MDKAQLIEATADCTTDTADGRKHAAEDVERVLDALFGTVEHPGTIAEALRRGETVLVGSFGSFQSDGRSAVFRPGRALTEYLHGTTR